MKFNTYRLKLRHDHGYRYLTVMARTPEIAKALVMDNELCPERAIIEITLVKVYRLSHHIDY